MEVSLVNGVLSAFCNWVPCPSGIRQNRTKWSSHTVMVQTQGLLCSVQVFNNVFAGVHIGEEFGVPFRGVLSTVATLHPASDVVVSARQNWLVLLICEGCFPLGYCGEWQPKFRLIVCSLPEREPHGRLHTRVPVCILYPIGRCEVIRGNILCDCRRTIFPVPMAGRRRRCLVLLCADAGRNRHL